MKLFTYVIARQLGCERKSKEELQLQVALLDINASPSLLKQQSYKTPKVSAEVIL
jgi:hypothetical protein